MAEREHIPVKALYWEDGDLVIETTLGKIFRLEGAVVTSVETAGPLVAVGQP